MWATPPRGKGILPLRQVAPNAVTATALCFGLTAIRFATLGNWTLAMGCVVLAGILDGLDGRIARLVKGESRFGAELDSLSDAVLVGVAPTLIVWLWSLKYLPTFGWVISLSLAVCCALRLARFNAQIDSVEQPHKSAGFLTGVPAPAGAGLAMLPLYLWVITGEEFFRYPAVTAPWVLLVAFLMISNVATFSWSSLRLRKNIRLEAIALIALLTVAIFSNPFIMLAVVSVIYLGCIPFSINSYRKVRLRARSAASPDIALPS
ncbi:MAG: phosphatidylcholine/phosphatidylserine synthase [Parasphingorhabdus sp.]|nr:phosphatidylcholine/phosphatidylserine synthase [Parasphingorhabdus sp.]